MHTTPGHLLQALAVLAVVAAITWVVCLGIRVVHVAIRAVLRGQPNGRRLRRV